ncbi:MAG: metalloregulator ArsR/SmtB family transcription factor [Chitinophagales bacterium]
MPNFTSTLNIDLLERAAEALRSIAHPIRLAILALLRNGEQLSVTEIHTHLEIEQAVASYHLNNLKNKGVLTSNRIGNKTFYFIKHAEVVKILEYAEHCFQK